MDAATEQPGPCQAAPDESKSSSRSEESARGQPRAGHLVSWRNLWRRSTEETVGVVPANQTAHVRSFSQSRLALATPIAYSYLALPCKPS